MTADDATRSTLKGELLQRIEALGLQQSIFPSPNESIDRIVQQLENLNPIDRPLNVNHLSSLIGNWQLIYASRGTVVTRKLGSLGEIGGGIRIKRVWQSLVASDARKISASNCAEFDLPLFGEWRLQADGVWVWGADEQAAKVTFAAFSVQATKPFGMSSWSLPELKIPVLEFLSNEALWMTSYLDAEIRVGRGATGNLFVFRSESTIS